jgi:CRISPR-associated endonuclease/helicase Cas3
MEKPFSRNGVHSNVSANILISDLAPMDRLVQRVGRVARYGGYGEVYILEKYSKVYDMNILKITKSLIQSKGSQIDWTLDARHLIDHTYSSLDPNDMIDRNLWYYLSHIDESLVSGAGDMVELIYAIKSFPRETSLVKAYAPQYFSNGVLSVSDGYIAVDSVQGSEIIQKSKKVIRDSRLYNLDQDYLHKFLREKHLPLSMLLEKEGFDGIILDRYQSGVGYV